MSKTKTTLVCLFTLIAHLVNGQGSNPLFDQLDFGSYPVGYQLIQAYDRGRSPLKEQLKLPEAQQIGRAVPIYFWYPADEKEEEPMSFKDYLTEWAYSWDFNLSEEEITTRARLEASKYHRDLAKETLDAYFSIDIETLATRNADASKGNFPLVIFSHGNMDRWWIWGEYLASHGIAVIGTPNSGAHQKRHEMGISGLEAQIRDAEFAISVVAEYDFIDAKSLIAAGSSYGSLSAAGLAARNDNVRGVISLDGIIADANEGELLQRTPYFDYQLFTTPILHMHSDFGFSSNYIWMDQMKYADQYRIKMDGLRHSDYHFYGMADLFGVNLNDSELKNSVVGFSWVMKYALTFVQGLTGKENRLNYLKNSPGENGVPEDLMEVDFVEGIKTTYSASELLEVLDKKGFAELKAIYTKMSAANPQPFSPITFFDVGIMMHWFDMIEEEKVWFGLFLESYPKSVEAMYRLARLDALTGNEELSKTKLEEAKRSLNDDPDLSRDRRLFLLSRIERFLN